MHIAADASWMVLLVALACTPATPEPVRPDPVPVAPEKKVEAPPPVVEPSPPVVEPSPPVVAPAPPEPAGPRPQGWPLDLSRELPTGCHGWSAAEATVLCVTGGGSIQSGHKYALEFIGGKSAKFPIVESPPLDFEERPLILPESARAEVAARLAAGGYVAIPEASGEIKPDAPFTGERFALRWTRKKTGHVDSGAGEWDIIKDVVRIECAGVKGKPRTLYTDVIENPGHDSVDVYVLSPNLVLIAGYEHFGVEGDIGGDQRALLVDLERAGCGASR